MRECGDLHQRRPALMQSLMILILSRGESRESKDARRLCSAQPDSRSKDSAPSHRQRETLPLQRQREGAQAR